MLYSINKLDKKITAIPHKDFYDKFIRNLSEYERDKISEALDEHFADKNIVTAGWIPGNNWEGTPFQAIFRACKEDKPTSAMLFGIIVFVYVMERADEWSCDKYQLDGRDIGSMTYFSIKSNK